MNLRLTILLATSLLGTGVFAEVTPAPQPKVERAAMTDEQRAQMEQRLNEVWSKLSVREKSQLMKLQHALREMPPEERKFIHDRVERFYQHDEHEGRALVFECNQLFVKSGGGFRHEKGNDLQTELTTDGADGYGFHGTCLKSNQPTRGGSDYLRSWAWKT